MCVRRCIYRPYTHTHTHILTRGTLWGDFTMGCTPHSVGFHFSEKATLWGALKKLTRDTLRGACVNNVGLIVCLHCGVMFKTLWG